MILWCLRLLTFTSQTAKDMRRLHGSGRGNTPWDSCEQQTLFADRVHRVLFKGVTGNDFLVLALVVLSLKGLSKGTLLSFWVGLANSMLKNPTHSLEQKTQSSVQALLC